LLPVPERRQVGGASTLTRRYSGRTVSSVNLAEVPSKLWVKADDVQNTLQIHQFVFISQCSVVIDSLGQCCHN
jgi:hypothetical protein